MESSLSQVHASCVIKARVPTVKGEVQITSAKGPLKLPLTKPIMSIICHELRCIAPLSAIVVCALTPECCRKSGSFMCLPMMSVASAAAWPLVYRLSLRNTLWPNSSSCRRTVTFPLIPKIDAFSVYRQVIVSTLHRKNVHFRCTVRVL